MIILIYKTLISLLEASSDHIKSSMIIDNGVLAFYRLPYVYVGYFFAF